MPNTTLPVQVKIVLPMDGGSAVFVGNEHKTIVIMIDTYVAHQIVHALQGQNNARPSSHELMGSFFTATGTKVQRLIINDVNEGQFFGRLILTMENEVKEMKIMEIDCRPSDGIILAIRNSAPILCSHDVWAKCEDVTPLMNKLTAQGPASPVPPGPTIFGDDLELGDPQTDDDLPF